MPPTFDDQAAAYDRWYTTPLGRLVDRVEKEALFTLLPELAGRLVLEVGCGTGNTSLTLVRRGAEVVGVDISAPMLAAARDKARSEGLALTFVRATAGSLPFGEDSFDGVVSILALDFIPDRAGAVAEMLRVLRPGGFLALALLNRYSLWTLKRLGRDWFRPSLWREARFTAPAELRRLLTARPELTDLRTAQAVYFPPFSFPPLVPLYSLLEHWGRRLKLPLGAFLAASARKVRTTY
ncbi:MAG: class I SAM-dependent methyltransferase [Desulfobaccales bacterium]